MKSPNKNGEVPRKEEPFARAIQKYNKKYSLIRRSLSKSKEKVVSIPTSKFAVKLTKKNREKALRRTMSYVNFRISEESDEDNSGDNEQNKIFNAHL